MRNLLARLAMLMPMALVGCGDFSPTLTVETEDTLADGRKVVRVGEHPVADLFLHSADLVPMSSRCASGTLVSTDPSVLRVTSAVDAGHTMRFELEALRQGDARLVGACGETLLTVDVHVTCAAD